jgi:hypothetical protein
MSLPVIALPTAVVELDGGHSITVRGLSRGEALVLSNMGTDDIALSECTLLAYGLEESLEAVQQWYQTVPSEAVKPLVEKIIDLSGLGENGARPTSEA